MASGMIMGGMIPILAGGCGPAENAEIRAVLDSQVQAWNRGDLDGFMQGYWKSDDLVLSTPQGETRGWRTLRDRYRRRYGSPRAGDRSASAGDAGMTLGRLRFEDLVISRQGEDAAQAAGRYRLERDGQNQSGRFFLHLRLIGGRWVIVRDRTVPVESSR